MNANFFQALLLMICCLSLTTGECHAQWNSGGIAPYHGYTNSNIFHAPRPWQGSYGHGRIAPHPSPWALPSPWGGPSQTRPWTGWSGYHPWLYSGAYGYHSIPRYGFYSSSRYGFGTFPPGYAWRPNTPWYGNAFYGSILPRAGFYRSPVGVAVTPFESGTINTGLPIYMPLELSDSTDANAPLMVPPATGVEVQGECPCNEGSGEFIFGNPQLRRVYSPSDRRW